MMRSVKGLLLIGLLVFIPFEVMAESSFDGLFQRGNEHFAAGDFSAAQDAYQTIVNQGGMDASVLYNLGNCHLKQGDIGWAILRYRQAIRIAPHDPDIIANLDVARSLVPDKIENSEASGIGVLLTRYASGLGSLMLTLLTAVTWLLTCGIIVVSAYSRRRRTRRKLTRVAICMGILFLGFSTLLTALVYEYHGIEYAVAVGDPVIARGGPGEHFTEVYQQQPGYEMKIKRYQDGYAEVSLANGYTAWVPGSSIAAI